MYQSTLMFTQQALRQNYKTHNFKSCRQISWTQKFSISFQQLKIVGYSWCFLVGLTIVLFICLMLTNKSTKTKQVGPTQFGLLTLNRLGNAVVVYGINLNYMLYLGLPILSRQYSRGDQVAVVERLVGRRSHNLNHILF